MPGTRPIIFCDTIASAPLFPPILRYVLPLRISEAFSSIIMIWDVSCHVDSLSHISKLLLSNPGSFTYPPCPQIISLSFGTSASPLNNIYGVLASAFIIIFLPSDTVISVTKFFPVPVSIYNLTFELNQLAGKSHTVSPPKGFQWYILSSLTGSHGINIKLSEISNLSCIIAIPLPFLYILTLPFIFSV